MADQQVEEQDTRLFEVTPWSVTGKVDYARLIKEFGTEAITDDLLARFEKVTGKPLHPYLTRHIFFSHRELDKFLTAYENGQPVFLYTGRGPTSESMHLGHMMPFKFTLYLQQCFNCPLVIQMADDEKFYFKELEFEEVHRLGFENAKDIIACGFDSTKTFIFSNRDYRLGTSAFEVFVSDMKKIVRTKTVNSIFGFKSATSTVGQLDWPFYQSAAAFSKAFPHIFNDVPAHCLVAYAIDQDPYFRLARDIAGQMDLIKPYAVMCTFIPPLTGDSGKMSSTGSTNDCTIYMTDSYEVMKDKVYKYAFSGGGGDGSLEDHRKYGGNPAVDMAYQYMRHFEHDDEVLKTLFDGFTSGQLSCADLKNVLIAKLKTIMEEHSAKRQAVTQADLDDFYAMKPMTLPTPLKRDIEPAEQAVYDTFARLNIGYNTIYHNKLETMEDGKELIPVVRGSICKNVMLKGRDRSSNEVFYFGIYPMKDNVNIKELSKKFDLKSLRFAEADVLTTMLQVPKGCANPFALTNCPQVTVLIDKKVSKSKYVCFHPMRNDATTSILFTDLLTYLADAGCTVQTVTN